MTADVVYSASGGKTGPCVLSNVFGGEAFCWWEPLCWDLVVFRIHFHLASLSITQSSGEHQAIWGWNMEKYVSPTEGQMERDKGAFRKPWSTRASAKPRRSSFIAKEKEFCPKRDGKIIRAKESISDRGCNFMSLVESKFFSQEKIYRRQENNHQGSPRHCLLNWSKGGISPNANEQRTIHVTQNIRYALNTYKRVWGREVTFSRVESCQLFNHIVLIAGRLKTGSPQGTILVKWFKKKLKTPSSIMFWDILNCFCLEDIECCPGNIAAFYEKWIPRSPELPGTHSGRSSTSGPSPEEGLVRSLGPLEQGYPYPHPKGSDVAMFFSQPRPHPFNRSLEQQSARVEAWRNVMVGETQK